MPSNVDYKFVLELHSTGYTNLVTVRTVDNVHVTTMTNIGGMFTWQGEMYQLGKYESAYRVYRLTPVSDRY